MRSDVEDRLTALHSGTQGRCVREIALHRDGACPAHCFHRLWAARQRFNLPATAYEERDQAGTNEA